MKPKTFFLTLGASLTAIFLVYLVGQVQVLKIEARSLRASLELAKLSPPPAVVQPEVVKPVPASEPSASQPKAPETPFEIADVMTKLQRHANKLYFAGKFENWPLADFYVEEIEETVGDVARKEIMDRKVNISGLMPALMNKEILELEQAVNQKSWPDFEKHYKVLISNCNACHVATQRPFLVIDLPRTPIFDNQHYEPVATATAQASVNDLLKTQLKSQP